MARRRSDLATEMTHQDRSGLGGLNRRHCGNRDPCRARIMDVDCGSAGHETVR